MSSFFFFIFGAKDLFLKAGSLGDLGVLNKCFSGKNNNNCLEVELYKSVKKMAFSRRYFYLRLRVIPTKQDFSFFLFLEPQRLSRPLEIRFLQVQRRGILTQV